MTKINNLELTVRTIESILPDMPTKSLKKWKGILETALTKIDAELTAVAEHACSVCLLKEFGYRDELPVGWREKGDLVICFNHEDAEIAKVIKDFLDKDEVQQEERADKALEELYAIL